ncbi:MAG: hypothetical protein RLZZ399_336 [Verrucomicrobiota bacterium]|jgi:Ca2+-binding EF-hand superfamily protein
MRIVTAIAALLALSAPLTFAKEKGEKPKHSPEESFKKLDTNGDGKVSVDEFTAKAKDAEKAKEKFKTLDADGDGSLTLEEFSAKPEGKKKK